MIAAAAIVFIFALEGAALVCAFEAMKRARTPQGSVGWVVFLISAPYVAVPVYLYVGRTRFAGYVVARRGVQEVTEGLDRLRRAHRARVAAAPGPSAARVSAFERLAQMPVVSGNRADLLVDGKATFDSLFDAISGARDYILAAFYIIRDDDLGRKFRAILEDKARSGVRVYLLYDNIGSSKLPRPYVQALRDAGAMVQDFHSIYPAKSRFQINFRNHRKIVVVDGETGFLGGINVADEYLGESKAIGAWRDTFLRLQGPAVSQLQLVFAEDWYWATETIADLNWQWSAAQGDADVLVLAGGPADRMETGSLYFCNAIDAARRRVWIASPYFVPDAAIIAALRLAAMRGVEVRVLLPEKRDYLLIWLAAFAFFGDVQEAGVQIWLYTAGFMHQKVLLVDDEFASVGTFNLDNRSCYLNFEATALVFDKPFVGDVERMLEDDFAHSRLYQTPLSDRALQYRVGAPFARLFAPLL